MMKKGSLIVFEGPDGVGKTTISTALAAHLRELGLDCEHLVFPGRRPETLGNHVYNLHHELESQSCSVHPASLQLLHVAAHIDEIENRIKPLLMKGCHVVLDRFWWSTSVYGHVSGVSPRSLRLMIQAELHHWERVQPSKIFLLDRSTPYKENDECVRWQRLRAEYAKLLRKDKRKQCAVLIKNEGSPEEILREVLSNLPASIIGRGQGLLQKRLPLSRADEPSTTGRIVFSRLEPAKATAVYDTYWRFAAERQNIFFKRLENCTPPWTRDEILKAYRFTNCYRASDRVSQYLVRNVIYSGSQEPDEILFRTLLFKVFNRIETWELLAGALGEVSVRTFRPKDYNRILGRAIGSGARIYSAAYIMPSGSAGLLKSGRKHEMHIELIRRMVADCLPEKLMEAPSMQVAFELIRQYPTVGNFLAYQFLIDLNYSDLLSFSEMDFVVPGPGARDGIKKCFSDLGGLSEADIIRLVADRQEAEFERIGIHFRTLWGRRLHLVDCQNLFCEVDKYSRVRHPELSGLSGRTRIKQRYRCGVPGLPPPFYPPKWGLNQLIGAGGLYV